VIAIPLTNGGVTLVDDADAQRVRQFAWRRDNRGYASRKVYIRGTGGVGKKSKYRTVLLHRFVLDAPEDMQTDVRIYGSPRTSKTAETFMAVVERPRTRASPRTRCPIAGALG
jgi:hypothetical protein